MHCKPFAITCVALLLVLHSMTCLANASTKPNFVVIFTDAPEDRIGFEEPFLVNLIDDVGETTNVAAENPQVVERLLGLAESMREDLGDYDRVGKNMRFFDPMDSRPTTPPVPAPAKPQARNASQSGK